MASRSSLSDILEVQTLSLPDGCMPGNVAPFVMRYGVDFLVAMQRAAAVQGAEAAVQEPEPA